MPREIAPGESFQLEAYAGYSDPPADVNNRVEWTTSDTSVIHVSSTGLVTGKNRGQAWVSARFAGGDPAGGQILVLPKGTFRLAGTIQESGFGIADVTVTVTAGTMAVEALALLEQRKITSVVVIDDDRRIEGVLHLHDLWRTGKV